MDNQVFISTRAEDIETGHFGDALAHTYCYQGELNFQFNAGEYTLRPSNCMILRRRETFRVVKKSDDLVLLTVFVTPEFTLWSSPRSNYGARGQLALYENPVIELEPGNRERLALDMSTIRRRLLEREHNFYEETVRNAVEAMILDFFDVHSKKYGSEKITSQYARLMDDFVAMLDRGDYVRNREINYYADHLCVTPKYLSEVCKKVSGHGANYWITRYTVSDIARRLRNKSVSLVDISDQFGFSSPSYFTRYVQKYLGVTPTKLRE